MPDILIRNFEMPKDHSLWLVIRPDGMVFKIKNNNKPDAPKEGTAIFLPEGHGRCIDADEISGSLAESATFNYNKRTSVCWSDAFLSMIDMLDDAPTIVPAEGG